MKKISIIVAIDKEHLIGKKGGLPWRLPADLKHFKETTTGHTIVMGRKTYDSIGKPLPNRLNIVLTRDMNTTIPGCTVVKSIQDAIDASPENQEIFIIGGSEIYKQFLPLAQTIYLTKIQNKFEGDIYFPPINHSEWEEGDRDDHDPDEKNPYAYSFVTLHKKIRN